MSQFSSNEYISLEKQIENTAILKQTALERINSVYEIEKCAKWIGENSYKKVCLQFPDYLLQDSTDVALQLQSLLNESIYILGDTAYESCCVDYVAAAHINADAIVHFGHVCYSEASDNVPCLKIYDKNLLDVGQLCETLSNSFQDFTQEIVVILDTAYSWLYEVIQDALREFNKVQVFTIDDDNLDVKLSTVLFVGGHTRKMLNFKLNRIPKQLFYYDPSVYSSKILNYEDDTKILKRRHFLQEKIRDGNTFGIVIATLAVKNYLRVIARTKNLLQMCGKKYYTISVGKPTVAKLANFPEIDIYIVISCAMNEIYDSREFYKPIVTPFDVEMALLKPEDSCVEFSFDYNSYLPSDLEDMVALRSRIRENDVSLISGNIRTIASPQDEDNIDVTKDSTALVVRNDGTVALNTNFGAGFLANRSWKGVEPNLGSNEVEIATEGRTGIAQSYQNERS